MQHDDFRPAMMPHIYEHVFEQFRIVGSDDSSIADNFADYAQWLESPGCLFQRNNFVLSSQIRSEGIIKAGLFLTVVLKGTGGGGPRQGTSRFCYTDNTIAVMALREPTPCGGDAQHPTAFVASIKASPRLQAIAMEMITPAAEGRTGELLLSAHATEILARVMVALHAKDDGGAVTDQRRMRLQAVRDLIESDLRHPGTIAQLARHAGVGRRSFNAQFHRMYGVSASDYLRTSRLTSAREALLHQGLSVMEAAYAVGYAN